jgi:hypothetical protein
MQVYEFALCSASDDSPASIERLGYIALPDDDDAIAFAKPIAEDLAQANGEYRGSVIKISSRRGHVTSIPVQNDQLESLRA